MTNRLAGKAAFVTGGSRGIGKAIAIALAEAGARVALTYNSEKDLAESVVAEITSKGGRAVALAMRVTDRPRVRAALAEADQAIGPLSILVNNAGINKPADFDKVTDEDWDEVIGVNLKGPFICAQEALPYLMRAGGGSIVNIGSVSGQYGGPRTVHYACSKAGLISMGQVIARFGVKHKIRSNTVAAGFIESEMTNSGAAGSAAVQSAIQSVPMGRLGTGREVADSVVFLASDEASYITGQTLSVNGGLYF